jgi:hypothetical protein
MEINFLGCDCLQVNCRDFIQAVSSICNHMFWGMVIIGIQVWTQKCAVQTASVVVNISYN